MIRNATTSDIEGLRNLFAQANDAPYDLAAVTEEKCFGEGIAGPVTTRVVERGGRIVAAAVQCGKWLRLIVVERGVRRQGLGSALLADAASVSVIAAEPGNYFTPGVPLDDLGALAFFHARGFVETQTTWNMHVTLADVALSEQRGVRRASHQESARVIAFVEREFGRIWRAEAAKAFERDVPPAFISEEGGEITGFVVHDVNNRGLGFFGPTGVAKTMRGRGVGGRLLLASLADMQRMGFTRAVIPWTAALDFYRKVCGATAAHEFATMIRT